MSALPKATFEQAYARKVYLAVELLDAVTMTRVRNDIRVVAEGLQGKPIVNAGGCFVWLNENGTAEKISVDPTRLPYEAVDVDVIKFPLTTIELPPRADYQFSPGVTGLRGTLIERRATPATPVSDGEVTLRWLDDMGVWHDAPVLTHTDQRSGDFVSFLRLAADGIPDIDASGQLTVQLHVRRGVQSRNSADFKLLQGRVTDPTTDYPLTFAWDDMLP